MEITAAGRKRYSQPKTGFSLHAVHPPCRGRRGRMPVPLTYSLRRDDLNLVVFCCAAPEDAKACSCLAAAADDLPAPLTNGALGYGSLADLKRFALDSV
jgi:hypothetical protein